jgi:hypothetical protein
MCFLREAGARFRGTSRFTIQSRVTEMELDSTCVTSGKQGRGIGQARVRDASRKSRKTGGGRDARRRSCWIADVWVRCNIYTYTAEHDAWVGSRKLGAGK